MPWFAAASPSPSLRSAPLVLVAHDSKVVADMIENVLAGSGISMEYAPNGLEALKKATDLRPQVMIVDVGLTGIYGFELCERLKSDPGTQNIKIVLLSSVYGLTAYKRSPVTLYGADDYIEKHHIPDKLLPKVRTLLEGGAPNAADRSAAPAVQQPAAGQQPAKPSPQTSAPLISMRGIVRVSSNPAVQQAPQNRPAPASQPSVSSAPAQAPSLSLPAVSDVLSVLPRTPVTLGGGKKAASEPSAAGAKALVRAGQTSGPPSVPADGAVHTAAELLEHDEYDAPAGARPKADPEEIEKARRFARIIVSDIVLYNQEAVSEGLQKGSFFELLKDDIAEGRSLYDKRVPETVRGTGDYLQEAFNAFISSKKKLR